MLRIMTIAVFAMMSMAETASAIKGEFSFELNAELLKFLDCKECGGKSASKISLNQKTIISSQSKCLNQVQNNEYTLYSASGDTSVNEVNFGDFFCSYKNSNWSVSLGFMSIEWSQNIGPQITDFFSAYDYRFTPFVGPRFRYTQPLLKLDYYTKSMNLSFFASTKPHSNKFSLAALNSVPFSVEAEKTEPFQKFDYGIRLSFQGSGADLSLSALSIQDRDPQPAFDSSVSRIFLKNESFQTYGVGSTFDFLGSILRLDYQFVNQRKIADNSFNLIPVNENAFSVGVDSPPLIDTIFSVQYSLLAPVTKNFVGALEPVKEFLILRGLYAGSNKKSLEVTGLINQKDQSKALKIDYSWAGNSYADLHTGAEYFYGEKDKSFSSYLNQSRIYLGISAIISDR